MGNGTAYAPSISQRSIPSTAGQRAARFLQKPRKVSFNPFFSKIEGNRWVDLRILSSDIQGRANLQFAAVSQADEVRGLGTGIVSCADSAKGALAGAIVGAQEMKGAQVGIIFSTAHHLAGMQASGMMSAAIKVVKAVQAAILCIADTVDGFLLQFGLVNIVHEVAGGAKVIQLGIINLIGTKIGFPLINIRGFRLKEIPMKAIEALKPDAGPASEELRFFKRGAKEAI